MKQLHRLFSFLFVLTLFSAFAAGCQKKEPECPFTTITWENTLEDIISLEGKEGETYDSVYGGMTYTYPKKYKEWDGTIKYMFNEEDKLVSLSWMYEAKDSEDLTDIYEQIHTEAEDMLGKSGFKFNSEQFADLASPGDVWYLDTGNVILNSVDASDAKLLQYTFLHPDVSGENPQNEK